jgi:hypothetical protein
LRSGEGGNRIMRWVPIGCAALAALLFAPPTVAASTIYPWCRHDSRGGVNCGFTSERQCLRAKTGNTDMCMLNGLYFPGPVRYQDLPEHLPPKREHYYRR